jgi:antitoxin MazE
MSRVQRWGNSLAVRLPKVVADQAGLREGADVTISVEDGTLVIRKSVKRTTLADLLAGCRDDNRHAPIEWGPPVGRELL